MIKKIALVAILAFFALIGWRIFFYPTQIIPYPYKMADNFIPNTPDADIYILGNEEALELDRFLPVMQMELTKFIQNDVKILNLATKQSSLARTIHKIKHLKQHPKVIIYMGNKSQLVEQTFSLNDQKTISYNFARFKDDKVASLIMSFPVLSKFVYKLYGSNFILTEKIKPSEITTNALHRQKQLALSYLFFENELAELIALCIDKKIELIYITSPINLESTPKLVCENSLAGSLTKLQKQIEKQIEQQEYKAAFQLAQELPKAAPANAKSYYLLGMIQKNLGMYDEAKLSLYSKNAFDCGTEQTNVIYNKIAQKLAKDHRFQLIDFDSIVNNNFGRSALFLTETQPQDIYYMMLIDELFLMLKNIYKL